jgi:hypothetical protein
VPDVAGLASDIAWACWAGAAAINNPAIARSPNNFFMQRSFCVSETTTIQGSHANARDLNAA